MTGTTRYAPAELEHMLGDIESDLVERKESLRGEVSDRVREAVCAFANDLPDHRRAGVVFVGAKDDGTPAGLQVTDELLRNLSDMKTDGNIVPPPTLTVSKEVLHGAEMAVVLVEPADSPPVRYRGRAWIRIGPRRAIASLQDERILNEKRRHRDHPFDVHPMGGATTDDLDQRMFETAYLPAAVSRDVLEANDRTTPERLAALKMIAGAEEPIPTVLGLLVLGVRTRDYLPGAYVQFVRYEGVGMADPIKDAAELDGTVSDVIRRTEEKIAAHNTVRVEITGGPIERRIPLYPVAALQQLIRNAIMHRTYEGTNAPVQVRWFSDRVEIQNPGGPFGTVSRENFGRPGVVDYRNPNLAEAMRVLGFVQRFGAGISIAQRELERNGNPPLKFEVEANHVAALVRAAL